MRILMVTLLLAGVAYPATAFDTDKRGADRDQDPSLSNGRFDLDVVPLQSLPMSSDGSLRLDSGLDPMSSPTPTDGRYSLESAIVDRSTQGVCNVLEEVIFLNGFEGP